ncbi:response regulator [Kutzneria sp. NPDC052558]|uniref:response regulator n=1 Tax=Kutzneria sp. NPDC052558 TaxID=3364121 RepID=UPI0037CB6C46
MRDENNGALRQVLIAVSDQRVRAALRTFLTANPRVESIIEAYGLDSALALARARTPTIAVVDVHLPTRNDGLSLIRRLSHDFAVPVVSIGMESSARRSALQAGAIRFLEKARVVDDLFDTLNALG